MALAERGEKFMAHMPASLHQSRGAFVQSVLERGSSNFNLAKKLGCISSG